MTLIIINAFLFVLFAYLLIFCFVPVVYKLGRMLFTRHGHGENFYFETDVMEVNKN